MDTMLIMDQPTNRKPFFLYLFFWSERFYRNNDPKKYKSDQDLSFIKREKGRLSVCLHVRSKYEVNNLDRKP